MTAVLGTGKDTGKGRQNALNQTALSLYQNLLMQNMYKMSYGLGAGFGSSNLYGLNAYSSLNNLSSYLSGLL